MKMKSVVIIIGLSIIGLSTSLEQYLPEDPLHEEPESVYAKPHIPLVPAVIYRPALSYGPSQGYGYVQTQGKPRPYPRPYTPYPGVFTTTGLNKTYKPQDTPLQHDPRDPDGDSIIGVAQEDYPIFHEIPTTSFQCSDQLNLGYFADQEARCQVFHICQDDGRQDSFLCPNGSIFNQKYVICDWWYNVDCNQTSQFIELSDDSSSTITTETIVFQDQNSTSSTQLITNITEKPEIIDPRPALYADFFGPLFEDDEDAFVPPISQLEMPDLSPYT